MIIGNKIVLVMFTLTTFILYLQMTREFSTRLQAAVQKSLGTDAIEDNGLDFVFIFFSQSLRLSLTREIGTKITKWPKVIF